LREELEELAQQLGIGDAVFFAGFVLNPFPWICQAQVLVSASLWEGFNNVLLQALACGTAVVATDCPHGARELLADGKGGRLVPMGNPAAMATAVLATLREPKQGDVLKEVAGRYDLDRQFSLYSRELQLAGSERQGDPHE
jgi:glycosyltransferase involved in cell wall biosynthesis